MGFPLSIPRATEEMFPQSPVDIEEEEDLELILRLPLTSPQDEEDSDIYWWKRNRAVNDATVRANIEVYRRYFRNLVAHRETDATLFRSQTHFVWYVQEGSELGPLKWTISEVFSRR